MIEGSGLDQQTVAESVVWGDITSMALTRKRATTIALEPEMDELLSLAAAARGVSRSEFIRQQLALVLEQFRKHPRPKVLEAALACRSDRGRRGDQP